MSMSLVLHLRSDVSNLSAARKYRLWLWLEPRVKFTGTHVISIEFNLTFRIRVRVGG